MVYYSHWVWNLTVYCNTTDNQIDLAPDKFIYYFIREGYDFPISKSRLYGFRFLEGT